MARSERSCDQVSNILLDYTHRICFLLCKITELALFHWLYFFATDSLTFSKILPVFYRGISLTILLVQCYLEKTNHPELTKKAMIR